MPFRIRPFRNGDFEILWKIDQICFDPQLAYSRPELAYYMKRSGSFTLVGEGDRHSTVNGESQILGFIVAELGGRPKQGNWSGHMITIDVVPAARRSGIGSALLDAAERQLTEAGATSVVLETAVNNETALRFYKKKGYFVEGTTPGYYASQLDAFVMRKELVKLVASR